MADDQPRRAASSCATCRAQAHPPDVLCPDVERLGDLLWQTSAEAAGAQARGFSPSTWADLGWGLKARFREQAQRFLVGHVVLPAAPAGQDYLAIPVPLFMLPLFSQGVYGRDGVNAFLFAYYNAWTSDDIDAGAAIVGGVAVCVGIATQDGGTDPRDARSGLACAGVGFAIHANARGYGVSAKIDEAPNRGGDVSRVITFDVTSDPNASLDQIPPFRSRWAREVRRDSGGRPWTITKCGSSPEPSATCCPSAPSSASSGVTNTTTNTNTATSP
jgi:hypothetical protein